MFLAQNVGNAHAAGRHAVIVDPQLVAALLRPARPHHPQIGPGDDHRIALERKDHAAFVVIVADIGLVHFSRAETRDQKAVEAALAHQRTDVGPAAVALGEREGRWLHGGIWHGALHYHCAASRQDAAALSLVIGVLTAGQSAALIAW